ncbi:MAG: 30S ribosomal protein S11 [Pseudomonadota bacterium]
MAEEKKAAPKRGKKKVRKNIPHAIVYVKSTFNNTIITVTDQVGNVIAWATSGSSGFKGGRRSTPFAAQVACEEALKKASDHGVRSVEVRVNGPGSGRESSLRTFQKMGIRVNSLRDITPIPHNGCRPPKRRRV